MPKRLAKGPSMVIPISKAKKAGAVNTGKCYVTHPPLPLKDGKVVYGGSCCSPSVKDAGIYIGFDMGMRFTDKSFPWEVGEEVFLKIIDRHAPSDPKLFKKLIMWTALKIEEGAKVHMGCIGGHGRTGTALSALVAHMGISDDPIMYVRENYCHKAVESEAQVNFLVKHWGVKPVKMPKYVSAYKGPTMGFMSGTSYSSTATTYGSTYEHKEGDIVERTGAAMFKSWNIWGAP